jgi:hypothetical protein
MPERARRVADAITWLRILLLPVIWMFALLGKGRAVGAGVIVAGVTDFLELFSVAGDNIGSVFLERRRRAEIRTTQARAAMARRIGQR